jgi:hypothetical protein
MGFDSDSGKFRINPMEITVVAVVSLILIKSAASLFTNREMEPAVLQAMAANPLSTDNREPAETRTRPFMELEIQCNGTPDQETTAAKLRLRGPFCGGEIGSSGQNLTRATVVNLSNKTTATVFTYLDERKFSTDYLPLNAGKNTIHVEFNYADGKSVSKDFTVTKN